MKTIMKALLFAALATIGACNKDDDNDNNNQSLNQTDRDFMSNATYGNNAEVDAGQLAQSKSTTAAIDNFEMMMVTDHTTAQHDLDSLAHLMSETLPSGIDAAHVVIKQQLTAMSGTMFDSAYIHVQVTDHQKTVQLFQNEISNGKSQRLKDYASKYLPKIQLHLNMADSIAAYY